MLVKKFDFSICAIANTIYVICGKDQQSAVSDTCEKYDCDTDQWKSISKCNINRYILYIYINIYILYYIILYYIILIY